MYIFYNPQLIQNLFGFGFVKLKNRENAFKLMNASQMMAKGLAIITV